MGLRINTNVQSLAAQRNLSQTSQAQKSSIEKLSSGSRIVRSSDDAAGLAISEKLRGQIRSIRQNSRNANDGVSMIQTAEGGMNEVGNILVRFRELAIQAASDGIGDPERSFIDKEVQELKSEITRIAKSVQYNGNELLSGELGPLELQIGQGNNADVDRFVFDPKDANVTADHLGISGLSLTDKKTAQSSIEVIDDAMNSLSKGRAAMGALQSRMQSAINNLGIYEENLSASRSRIADVDMASEAAELTKNSILSQTGISVLSQANQNPTLALKLVG